MDKIPPSEGGDAGSIPAERIVAKQKSDFVASFEIYPLFLKTSGRYK